MNEQLAVPLDSPRSDQTPGAPGQGRGREAGPSPSQGPGPAGSVCPAVPWLSTAESAPLSPPPTRREAMQPTDTLSPQPPQPTATGKAGRTPHPAIRGTGLPVRLGVRGLDRRASSSGAQGPPSQQAPGISPSSFHGSPQVTGSTASGSHPREKGDQEPSLCPAPHPYQCSPNKVCSTQQCLAQATSGGCFALLDGGLAQPGPGQALGSPGTAAAVVRAHTGTPVHAFLATSCSTICCPGPQAQPCPLRSQYAG